MINSVGSSSYAASMMTQTRNQSQLDPAAAAEKLMALADSNGDSTVSESEFSALFSDQQSSTDVAGLFNQMDTNGDGSLSSSEAVDSVSQLIDQLQAARAGQSQGAMGPPPGGPMGPPPDASSMVSDNDSDGNGSLSLDEFTSMLSDKSSTEASNMFSAADTNGDGQISADELQAAMASQQPQQTARDDDTLRMVDALLAAYQSGNSDSSSSSVSVTA